MNSLTKAKIFCFIIILSFATSAFSQEKKTESSYILKLNATALIDYFSFPTVQLALEKKLNDNFSVQAEFGLQLYDRHPSLDTVSVNVNGFKANAEVRFYLFNYYKKDKSKKRNSDGIYVGIQGFYRENKDNRRTEYYIEEISDDITYVDYFGVIKKIYGANVALGFQKPFGRFILEPYIYIGLMVRDVKNIDRVYDPNLGHVEDNGPHDFFGSKDLSESSGNKLNFSLGLRLGYRF